MVHQALEMSRLATADTSVHDRVVRDALRALVNVSFDESPPAMAQYIGRTIAKITGETDPYREIKDRFNQLVLADYAALEQRVEGSDDPFETAVRLAIAGNVIDFGIRGGVTESQVSDTVGQALTVPLDGDVARFFEAVEAADSILYLSDNAAEIVFDRLLIEQFLRDKTTVAVRGAPAINDATMVDAEDIGLTKVVEVIDNGSDAPGTILEDCSSAFRQRFESADLVIAKGQGNYETLSEVDKDIYFLLKAKCPVIARDIGCRLGAFVLRRSTDPDQATLAVAEKKSESCG